MGCHLSLVGLNQLFQLIYLGPCHLSNLHITHYPAPLTDTPNSWQEIVTKQVSWKRQGPSKLQLTLLPFFMRWNVGATFTPRLCPSCLFFLLQSSLYSLMSGWSCMTAVITKIKDAEPSLRPCYFAQG